MQTSTALKRLPLEQQFPGFLHWLRNLDLVSFILFLWNGSNPKLLLSSLDFLSVADGPTITCSSTFQQLVFKSRLENPKSKTQKCRHHQIVLLFLKAEPFIDHCKKNISWFVFLPLLTSTLVLPAQKQAEVGPTDQIRASWSDHPTQQQQSGAAGRLRRSDLVRMLTRCKINSTLLLFCCHPSPASKSL